MASKNVNIAELVTQYDDEFIKSISLMNISSNKEFKELLLKLERANQVVTTYYQMLYNDFIMSINSHAIAMLPDKDNLMHYKNIASKIQKAYSYMLYIYTFENPFKSIK